jgi:hypothetical protein
MNDKPSNSLHAQIVIAHEVALVSTRNAEDIATKFTMTPVELNRTNEKAIDTEARYRFIGVRRGVYKAKGVEDSHRPSTLQAGHL